MLNFSQNVFVSIEVIYIFIYRCIFLVFNMNYTNKFSNVKTILHSWDQLHFVKIHDLFYVSWNQFAKILFLTWGHIGLQFLRNVFVWLWNQSNSRVREWAGKCAHLFSFLEEFVEHVYMFSRIHQCGPYEPGVFLVGKFWTTNSISSIHTGLFRLYISS